MTNNALQKKPSKSSNVSDNSTDDSIKLLAGRQANELIIGLCGPVGAGFKTVRSNLQLKLLELGYDVKHIQVSQLMKEIGQISDHQTGYERYKTLQDLGDKLRYEYSPQILAEAITCKITKIKKELKESLGLAEDDRFPGKVAYIVDQLKNPSEVELLRLIYQNNFYLIGILRSEQERKRNLRDEGINPKEVDDLIHRDRRSEIKSGQQTEKTILDSDFFLKNNQSHVTEINRKIQRFLDLIHGVNGISPSIIEKGMFTAFSASLQSACLSRQVGAAILDSSGNVITTGRNDVPRFGGGLYSYEDGDKDYRCIHKGAKCYNDAHKNKIKNKILSEINIEFDQILKETALSADAKGMLNNFINANLANKIANRIYKNTSVGSLIEYSRAIHAEMDAITTLARTGDGTTKDKILFTTTYPCHNCARHIVAAGIKKAVYIEPYEKSLAIDLHDDAISNDINSENNKVVFEQFEGISPRRYQKFFFSSSDRKDSNGNSLRISTRYSNHVDIQFLDSYQDMEIKIAAGFLRKLGNDN